MILPSVLPVWLQIAGAFIVGFWVATSLMFHFAMIKITRLERKLKSYEDEEIKDTKEFVEWENIKQKGKVK
jgi:uncharacterized membrane protein YciS (DUF1049 family)